MSLSRRDALAVLATAGLTGLPGCVGDDLPADGGSGSDEGGDGSPPADAPAVVNVSAETVESSCFDPADREIDVVLATEVVEVTGVINAPNPCHEVVASASVEGSTLTVHVDVESHETDDCIQCVGSLQYEVIVELSADGIGTVDVIHTEDGVQTSVDADESPTPESAVENDILDGRTRSLD